MSLQIPAFTTDLAYPFWVLNKMTAAQASPGVVNQADYLVTPSSGLQVSIGAGQAFVQQTVALLGSEYEGLYWVLNDGPVNPSNVITAPVSNPRWDMLALIVTDVTQQRSGGASNAVVKWVTGSENSAATLTNIVGLGTLPSNSLCLAYVLQTVGESSISSSNILQAGPRAQSTLPQASRGAVNISASQATSSTSYATLSTPDEVTNVVLPTNGLIAVWYQATWQESVNGAARAALFLDGAEVVAGSAGTGGSPGAFEAAIGISGGVVNRNVVLSSYAAGVASVQSSAAPGAYAGDATTGQAVFGALDLPSGGGYVPVGGACYVSAPAGTYSVSVRFKTSSGSVTASNRKLWVQVLSFA